MVQFAPIVARFDLLPDLGADPGPGAGSGPEVAFAPIKVRLRLVPSDDDTAPVETTTVAMPPISFSLGVGLPEVSATGLILSAPSTDAIVPTSTPPLTVGVILDDDVATDTFTVEVQYADNASMTNPTTLSASMQGSDGGVTVNPTTAVPSPAWWRARLLSGASEVIGWSSPSRFTVAASVAPVTLPVSWAVGSGAARPIHLWHIDPAGPEVGDLVTVYGQGFPANGFIYFNGEAVTTVQSWELIPATAENSTDQRRIDGPDVTCEHYEVVFTAPVYDGPGAPLSVEA